MPVRLNPVLDLSHGGTDEKRLDNLAALAGVDQTGANSPVAKIKGIYYLEATINPAALADGAGATASVTFNGAALGDFVLASAPYDLVDVTVTAYVQAANT